MLRDVQKTFVTNKDAAVLYSFCTVQLQQTQLNKNKEPLSSRAVICSNDVCKAAFTRQTAAAARVFCRFDANERGQPHISKLYFVLPC